MNTSMKVSTLALAVAAASHVAAQESSEQIEEVIVVSQATTFANTVVSDTMKLQNSAITSVNDLIDNLPGVSVQEGDAFGFDDWSTAIAVRGFQTNLAEQQVGSTIDGLPNGNSNYGGGSKANRSIDTAHLAHKPGYPSTAGHHTPAH